MICLNIPHLLQRLALVFFLFSMGQAFTQPVLDSIKRGNNPLNGLTKAGPGDIKEGTPLMLGPFWAFKLNRKQMILAVSKIFLIMGFIFIRQNVLF